MSETNAVKEVLVQNHKNLAEIAKAVGVSDRNIPETGHSSALDDLSSSLSGRRQKQSSEEKSEKKELGDLMAESNMLIRAIAKETGVPKQKRAGPDPSRESALSGLSSALSEPGMARGKIGGDENPHAMDFSQVEED